jgi:hypothetical protein
MAVSGHLGSKSTTALAPNFGATAPTASRQPKTERFREQAAIRFRHAMRGEWDVVNHLQTEPPFASRYGLPQLVNGKTPEKIQTSWADAWNKFDRRQCEAHWQARHRQSITNWTRGSDADEQGSLSRETRSLPNLRLNSAPLANTRATFDDKTAELNAQEARFLESMPADSVRFGKDALPRLKHVCKALQVGGNSSHPNGHAVTDCIQYDCDLCHGRHGISVPYMA